MAKKAQNKVQKAIGQALALKGGITPALDAPEYLNGKRTKLVSVRDNIISVQESRPLEFLTEAMNKGTLTYTAVDQDGIVREEEVPIPVKVRVDIAKFLTSKLLPSLHVMKVVKTDDEDEAPVKTGFDALVQRAVDRGRQTS